MNYAQKRQQEQQTYLQIGMDLGMQRMADIVAIVLNDRQLLGSRAMGSDTLAKVFAKVLELDSQLADAYTRGPEADYCQERMDRRLLEIYGKDRFVPFNERYPMVRQKVWR